MPPRPQPLDNLEIVVKVLKLDDDATQTALIGHVLQGLLDENVITFPIHSVDELQPLLDRANDTPYPEPTSHENLRSPDPPEILPLILFPIGNMDDFLLKTLSFLRFYHALGFQGKN